MEKYIHKVKYYECDRMGITHHSNYIRFMEEARVDALDQIGYGFEKMESDGYTSPVVSLSADYKAPTTFQDEIEIEVFVKEITTLKMTFGYEMKCRGKLVFRGSSVHCFFAEGRPVSIQERYTGLYEALMQLKK